MIRIISANPVMEAVFGLCVVSVFVLTHPAYMAFRRRRSSHGRVFNSVTGKPEALVAVALRDLHGSVVRSTVTDRHGKYRIVAPKGDYIVEVRKFGFTFPSKIVKDKKHPDYENVLNTAHIVVGDYGSIVKNIPLDPVAAGRGAFRWPRLLLPKGLQNTIFGLSPFAAFATAYVLGSMAGWLVFSLFCVAFILRITHYKPAKPPFGTITDAGSGHPLEGVAVRVLDKKFNKVLETQITSPKGRYAFVVNHGSYRILMKKKGYKSVILNFNGLVKDGQLLAKDVKVTPLPIGQIEKDEPEQAVQPQAPAQVGDL